MTEIMPSQQSPTGHSIQTGFGFHFPFSSLSDISLTLLTSRYRTLSICVEERQQVPKFTPDPADAIARIDVHLLSVDEVYARYSSHPTVGLEIAAVRRRRERDGKNIISPPPTVYWKKTLNYIFGGFNFLMWIAFILTIASPHHCPKIGAFLTYIQQLSYEPLGPPQGFVLGVAVLLVRVFLTPVLILLF
jgi:sodium/potassium-transporting ATPase subunit alpha